MRNVEEVRVMKDFERVLKEALNSPEYFFIVVKVELEKKAYEPLPFDKTENAVLFQRALAVKGLTPGYHTAIARHYELP